MKQLFPSEKLIETELFIVNQDWEVPIPGFYIVAPKRKLKSLAEFTDKEAQEFIRILRKVRKGMKAALGIDEAYFFQNEDTVHNFHFWVFPRHNWMEGFGKSIQSVRPIIEYAKHNLGSDEGIGKVKAAVTKMRAYLNSACLE
jgi:diadenosine tetraphosphate (Ap4A) HIT family hydrolase